jgi:proteasome accessory factor A
MKLKDGRTMTALEIQKEYLEACLAYAQHVDADPVTRDILDRWTDMLTRLGTV